MVLVYIAGKLNDTAVNYLKNVSHMCNLAVQIRRMGFSVFVPCLDMLLGIVDGNFEYEHYADNNMTILERSDVLFVMPDSDESRGTQAEIARARELNIPIIRDLGDLNETHRAK